MLGGWFVLAAAVALLQASERGGPEFGAVAMGLGVLVVLGAIGVIGVAVHGLREIQGLPETAQRMPVLWAALRVSLSVVVPVGAAVFASTASAGAGWILGLAFAALGAALCIAAALATHVEYLCGARVWRAQARFYFAR